MPVMMFRRSGGPGAEAMVWLAVRGLVANSAAIRSAIMTVGMWVLADGMSGITDASATDRPSIPWTAPAASTTEPQSGAGPMAHVPTGW